MCLLGKRIYVDVVRSKLNRSSPHSGCMAKVHVASAEFELGWAKARSSAQRNIPWKADTRTHARNARNWHLNCMQRSREWCVTSPRQLTAPLLEMFGALARGPAWREVITKVIHLFGQTRSIVQLVGDH